MRMGIHERHYSICKRNMQISAIRRAGIRPVASKYKEAQQDHPVTRIDDSLLQQIVLATVWLPKQQLGQWEQPVVMLDDYY